MHAYLGTESVLLRRGRLALVGLSLLTLAACGGSGGNGGNNFGGGLSEVTISGTVSYEFPPPNANCNGLNFGGTLTLPIRGATVQLMNASTGAEMARVISSAIGGYSFSRIPANTTVQIRVRAELKQSGAPSWDVEIRDNFIAGASDLDVPAPPSLGTRALYVLDGANFNSGSANVVRNLTATTGWNGTRYAGPRTAAPFALLDTFYAAMQFVRATDANANFPPLDAFWSVNNTTATAEIDITAGQLWTSGYLDSIDSLFILGDRSSDTDEFDDHVVSHEWSHYFEDNFSRSDSPGGSHFLGESLEPTLAFGEGWASALGSMLLGSPINCDTGVPGTSGGGGFSVESNSFGVKGWFNEVSVATLIYDLWDTGVDGVDNGSVGFGALYNVMIGPQIVTTSFTTLFAFASELRASLSAPDAALLDALLDRENVVSGTDLDIWASNETNDAGVAQDVFPLYVPYTADGSILNVCMNSSLDGLSRHGNNIGENRYLRITVPADDEYDVVVVSTTPTPVSPDPDDRDQSDPDIYIIRGAGPENAGSGSSPVENSETFRTPVLFAGETYVAYLEEWRFDDNNASITYPSRMCFDVSLTPTP